MASYDANNIETLDFRTAIRTKIAMYVGSADNQGVLQGIREIISNSIDEFTMGYGHIVNIELSEGNRITVSDTARGCPFGNRDDGSEAMEAIFLTAHSGGKFDEKVYQSVVGMNGIGAKAVALSSDYFQVISCRNDRLATLTLEKGIKTNFDIRPASAHFKSGTTITWIPSQEVYHLEPIFIDFEQIKEMCQNWSYLNQGLKFSLTNNITGEKIVFLSKSGIVDLLKNTLQKPLHPPISYTIQKDRIIMEIAFQWSNGFEQSYVFTNGLHNLNGGTSLTGAKTAITRTINNLTGNSFSGEAVRKGLVYIISAKIPNASFSDQTKTKINNPELRTLGDEAFSQAIKKFFEEKPADFDKVISIIGQEFRAENAAAKAREKILNAKKEIASISKNSIKISTKLSDCRQHGEQSVLILTEGLSAATPIQKARSINNEAVYALRGKIINALKSPLEDVLENQEVRDIIGALGCSFNESYNPRKLKYGKVLMCVDGDSDGKNIACLVVTLFRVLMPSFIKEGRLGWLQAPLYGVTTKTGNYYAYNDEELALLPKGEIIRYKGLGQMDEQNVKQTMFDPKNRRIDMLTYDENEGFEQLEMLMGTDVKSRRLYIYENVDFHN